LKTLFEASTYPASEEVAVAEICCRMWAAAAVALGTAGPVNWSASAGGGEDTDNGAGKLVGEDG
jgi:hypothetical protein